MKTVTHWGQVYRVVRVDPDGVVVDLPKREIVGHVSRTTLPFNHFGPALQTKLRRLVPKP